MLRIILIAFFLLLLLVGVALAGTVSILSNIAVFHPGSSLYSLQHSGEQTRLGLTFGDKEKIDFALLLLERRTNEMVLAAGKPVEMASLFELNQELDQTLLIASALEPNIYPALPRKLNQQSQAILLSFSGISDSIRQSVLYQQMAVKMNTLEQLLNSPSFELNRLARIVGLKLDFPADLTGTSLPWSPTSGSSQELTNNIHAFFPLVGAHAQVRCATCHANGYDTPLKTECRTCHTVQTPQPHYQGDCGECHKPVSWQGVPFQHAADAQLDCLSCHEATRPANHFPGQCSLCHTTVGWASAYFPHPNPDQLDCKTCHNTIRPDVHYSDGCQSCHSPNSEQGWQPVGFDHIAAQAEDCQTCHQTLAPAKHYTLQCSTCHTTTGWKPAAFAHASPELLDCKNCHSAGAPANHYPMQCITCHSTTAWKPVTFDHTAAKAINCLECHTGNQPAQHFNTQCSACHTTTGWEPANFSHEAAGATNCVDCHSSQKPAGHYEYQCSLCHSSTGWMPANFSHSFPIHHGNAACQSCHPSGPPSYSCTGCHSVHEDGGKNCISCHAGGAAGEGDD
jgi:hypothetical protein